MHPEIRDARILVVDDEDQNIRLLDRILRRDGFQHVRGTTDPRKTLDLFDEYRPDLLLLDLRMPHMDGFAVLEALADRIPREEDFPILVLTADLSPEARLTALNSGAKDFVTKPFDQVEVLLRIRNLLESRVLFKALRTRHEALEETVRDRTRALEDARIEVLERLALAAEFRDDTTGQHTQRVGRTSALIARALGLGDAEVDLIRRAAPLHDLGKIGIPDAVLLKPGRLTPEEFEVMKSHTGIGARILSGSRIPTLELAAEIALSHHERWDGTGYPSALCGADIPLAGRIVSVADVFDALIHHRPYKRGWTVERARAEIRDQAGRQFDPDVVDAFLRVSAETDRLREPAGA